MYHALERENPNERSGHYSVLLSHQLIGVLQQGQYFGESARLLIARCNSLRCT
jgi:hypothetical protein